MTPLPYIDPAQLENLNCYYARFCQLRGKLGVHGAWEQVEREYESAYPGQHRYTAEKYASFVSMYKRRDRREKRQRKLTSIHKTY